MRHQPARAEQSLCVRAVHGCLRLPTEDAVLRKSDEALQRARSDVLSPPAAISRNPDPSRLQGESAAHR